MLRLYKSGIKCLEHISNHVATSFGQYRYWGKLRYLPSCVKNLLLISNPISLLQYNFTVYIFHYRYINTNAFPDRTASASLANISGLLLRLTKLDKACQKTRPSQKGNERKLELACWNSTTAFCPIRSPTPYYEWFRHGEMRIQSPTYSPTLKSSQVTLPPVIWNGNTIAS